MTMGVMEATEQQTRQRMALQQIRDMPEVMAALDQPRISPENHTEPVQAYQPALPSSSHAHLPPGTHLVDFPHPRTNQEGSLITYTPAEVKQVRHARATRHGWLMEAVGCSREMAEMATRNMDYNINLSMVRV